MKLKTTIALASMLAFSGAAFAQAPATAPAAPAISAPKMTAPAMTAPKMAAPTAAAPAATGAKAPRSAKSLECSSQADTQGLHGKPRKAFMSKCKKG
jgi:hypothetical protein